LADKGFLIDAGIFGAAHLVAPLRITLPCLVIKMRVQSIANGTNIVTRISLQKLPSDQLIDFRLAYLNHYTTQPRPSPVGERALGRRGAGCWRGGGCVRPQQLFIVRRAVQSANRLHRFCTDFPCTFPYRSAGNC